MTTINLLQVSPRLTHRWQRISATQLILRRIAYTHGAACREAFRRVRRDVWNEREARLVAKWESYG